MYFSSIYFRIPQDIIIVLHGQYQFWLNCIFIFSIVFHSFLFMYLYVLT